jgi:hypothetical protein
MNNEKAQENAAAEATALVKAPSIGYAINLVMDYGSGRQVTISGTLPLGATLKDMNEELDKLRLATNRQSSLVILRDIENTVALSKKTIAAIELMISTYEAEMEKEMATLKEGPKSGHSMVQTQITNMRAQATNYRVTKNEELQRAKLDMEKGELVIARIKKELED